MDSESVKQQLDREGYRRIFVWTDAPGARYPDHTHPGETAHIVLAGEIVITSAEGTQTYKIGGRFDVPAGAVHSAAVGPKGCTYVVGEK